MSLILGVLALAPGGASAQAPPSIALSQSTGLVTGDVVTVTGEGFAPNTSIAVGMCRAGGYDLSDCDQGTALLDVAVDGTGAFQADLTVYRDMATFAGGVQDCAVSACEIAAGPLSLTQSARTSVSFTGSPRPPRTFQADALLPDPTVVLTGAGLPERSMRVELVTCAFGSCNQVVGGVTVGADGVLDETIELTAALPGTLEACEPYTCRLQLRIPQYTGSVIVASAWLAVDGPPPAVLTVTVDDYGTLDPTYPYDNVVASGAVSCDQETDFSLHSIVSQGDVSWGYTLNSMHCTPGTPTKVWFPSRSRLGTSDPYVLGEPVSVEVRMHPYAIYYDDRVPQYTSTEDVTLLDGPALAVFFQALLAQPDQDAFRAAFLEAVSLRAAQDADFRWRWFHMIFGA
ncbi:MAG: hypothetical protein KF906_07395 [Actinobacteria bacterium]|nr:hypothetical protein [Actinomycetota bacterium]